MEIQQLSQRFFKDRIVYYSANLIREQGKSVAPNWNYLSPEVYVDDVVACWAGICKIQRDQKIYFSWLQTGVGASLDRVLKLLEFFLRFQV